MRTLLSINNYYYRRGGAEAVFLEHNRLFEEAAWRVVPFAMRHPKNEASSWSDYFVDEIEFGSEYSILEKMARASKIVFSFESRRKLSRLLTDTVPDICHAHNIYHHLSPSILGVLKQQRIPTVLTLHDLKIACPAYKMLSHDGICERCRDGKLINVVRNRCVKGSISLSALIYLESALHRFLNTYARNVDRFVVPSRFYRDKLVEWGWDAKRFVHIPNFVDVAALRPAEQVGESFIYFGRLGPEKGLDTLIRAAARAGVKLLIGGIGPMKDALEATAVSVGADVTFLGHLSGSALHDAVRSARAAVIPSEWYENAPISVMEAYALAKPVIGARIGGIPELIREEETGITFTSGSVDELAEAMRKIISMSDLEVARMGFNGRAWMQAEFTDRHYRDRITHLYEGMLASNGSITSDNQR